MNFRKSTFPPLVFAIVIAALLVSAPAKVAAQRRGGGGGRQVQRGGGGGAQVNRQATHTSIRSNQDVNRNVNVNRDVNRNVNRDVNIDRDIDVGFDNDRWGHPIARGVAAAVAVGTTVALLPPDCTTVMVGDLAYNQCGSVWYQPYYSGATVQYIAVNPPQ